MARRPWLVHPAVIHIAFNLAAASGALAEPRGRAHTPQKQPRQMLLSCTPCGLAVAWNDSTSGAGMVRAMSVLSPWEFQTPPVGVGAESVLRVANGRVYVVSRADGTVTVIDSDTWTTSRVYSLGAGSEPMDIVVVSPERAYVTRRTATHLLRLDLLTGATEEVVDLGVFADSDGVPDMGMMAAHEGRLFVQIRRLGAGGSQFVPPAYLAVVDLDSQQLIDVDPATPGVQAVELQGTPPKLKMQIVPQTRQLFVSATGQAFDEGGIEVIDLDTLQSLGMVVRESDGKVGVDLGPFVMVSPDRGYLVYTTDFAISSHLVSFSITGGVGSEPLYETVDYFAPTLELDPQTDTFFLPVGGHLGDGVHVFDAATGARLTLDPIATSGGPSDIALVCDGLSDCGDTGAVPTTSTWGLVLTTLLLLTGGTVVLSRQLRSAGALSPGRR